MDDNHDARIVYEDPVEGTVERDVENEHLAYFQDHWILKTGERDGRDVIRRIPVDRVHYVERTVPEFADEVSTLKSRVESVADDLREKFRTGREETTDDVTRIEVESGDEVDE